MFALSTHPALAYELEVPSGYEVELIADSLTYPGSIEFDDEGNMYVAEIGYSYGDTDAQPMILKTNAEGLLDEIA